MNFLKLTFTLALFATSVSQAGLYRETNGEIASWSYDDGPNASDPMGKELIDIIADSPYMPEFSEKLLGRDKFRKYFGPTWWRMLIQPANSMKILFIGQDATHIAEAAERTATAGFGGRAQDLARYFGVREGAGFINWSAFTIRGQYGSFDTPYFYKAKNGKVSLRKTGFISNSLWLMGQDPRSPMAKTRNDLIDWIIRRHKKSLKLVVLFGGAARDAMASFIESKGHKVGSRISEESLNYIRVPMVKEQYAGGNNVFPVVLDRQGKDLSEQIANARWDYKDPKDQKQSFETLVQNMGEALEKAALTYGGVNNSGILHPAQIGGYDLKKIYINGKKTRSLKGLALSDGSRIQNDVLVSRFPHPSALSRMSKDQASKSIAQNLKAIQKYVDAGWEITPDQGLENEFANGKSYVYGRSDIGPEYYDFGTPQTRMVPVSSASRMSKKPHVIVFGTRNRASFDQKAVERMTNGRPSQKLSRNEIHITRPIGKKARYTFDPGPGEKYARIMKENLNLKNIFKTKKGKSWDKDGISAFNVKNHPDIGDFGHYRGTFNNPQVIILADPQGYDDLITARALTGTRGQYLHGLMEDLGVNDQYLVIKTVPFGMDGATDKEWNSLLEQTQTYRKKLLSEVLQNTSAKLIIADGPYASLIANKELPETQTPVILIDRKEDGANNYGLTSIAELLSDTAFAGAKVSGQISDIPRSHLSFYARHWQGTSGDRVLVAKGKYQGLAFAEIAPKWAWSQRVSLSDKSQEALELFNQVLSESGLKTSTESVLRFFRRQKNVIPLRPWTQEKSDQKERKAQGL